MIIDFRIRPPYKSFLNCGIFQPWGKTDDPTKMPGLGIGRGNIPSVDNGSWELFLKEMEEAGIDRGVIMGRQAAGYGCVSNDDIEEIVRDYPDKFIPFAGIDPSDPVKAVYEIERTVKSMGFKGISMEPGWCNPPLYADDKTLDPIYEKCQELGAICSITSSIMVGPDMSYSHPINIQRVALRYPDLKIVIPHACWPHVQEVLGMALQCMNVYLVPDFYGYIPNTPMANEYVKAANYYLKYRMMFASSYPVRDLKQSVEQFKNLAFDSDVLENCLFNNAVRVLGL